MIFLGLPFIFLLRIFIQELHPSNYHAAKPYENEFGLQHHYNVNVDRVAWNDMTTALTRSGSWCPPIVNRMPIIYRESPPAIGLTLPKAASSSFRASAARCEKNSKEKCITGVLEAAGFGIIGCRDLFDDPTKSYLLTDPKVVRFAVVRDPFNRFVAAFNQISLEGLTKNRSVSRQLLRPNATRDPHARFSEFIQDNLVQGSIHQNIFTEMQTVLLLKNVEGRWRLPKLTFLTSVERLDKDLPELYTLLGIPKHAEKLPEKSYGGYGGKLVAKDALSLIKENSAASQAFCNNYAADYVFLGIPLPSWCLPGSQQNMPPQTAASKKLQNVWNEQQATAGNFLNAQAAMILHDQ